MNIGLIDIDRHNFPNLVLMKLSAWHKAKGDDVSLCRPAEIINGSNLFEEYDLEYGACVFTGNKEVVAALEEKGIVVGGTGTINDIILPRSIEHIMPDYSLYGITDTAYGFLSRGCPRQCPFCIVSSKEGPQSRKVADLSEWWDGQRYIKLLDPNLLACPEHEDLLEQLAESGAAVDITQGLDARLLTYSNMEIINRLKIKAIHFAWGNPRDELIKDKLTFFMARTNMSVRHRKPSVYVLTNYWSTHEEDLTRVYWLRDNGFEPYVMIYDKPNAPQETRWLQRWVNNKRIFACTEYFEDYKHDRSYKREGEK